MSDLIIRQAVTYCGLQRALEPLPPVLDDVESVIVLGKAEWCELWAGRLASVSKAGVVLLSVSDRWCEKDSCEWLALSTRQDVSLPRGIRPYEEAKDELTGKQIPVQDRFTLEGLDKDTRRWLVGSAWVGCVICPQDDMLYPPYEPEKEDPFLLALLTAESDEQAMALVRAFRSHYKRLAALSEGGIKVAGFKWIAMERPRLPHPPVNLFVED